MKYLFNNTICGIVLLVVFIGLGTGILVWLSPVSEEQLTPAQKHLVDIADLMVKGALGGAAGFIIARALPNR
jgi:hypothetical protein